MKIIAMYCSKGGVGKTATAVNLSYTAARNKYASLLCDLDPQGASSYYFRMRPKKKFSTKKLIKGHLTDYIRATDYDDLDLLPAHFSHRNFDLLLDRKREMGIDLKEMFASVASEYDLLFLDCPPNLTLLSEHILKSADIIVAPVIPTTLSLISLKQLLKLSKKLNVPTSKIHAFFSMVEKRKNMHLSIISQYKKNDLFMRTLVGYMAEIEKMGVLRQPVGASSTRSVAALAYERLWKEVETRGGLR